jgi:glyceraldehyde 3-phosphate dehydrogenase
MGHKVAINGFGRIGRCMFRIIRERKQAGQSNLVVSAINDLADNDTLAHLLKYDSVHGRFPGTVESHADGLVIDGTFIHVSKEREPEKLPWNAHGIDVVLESTGHFLTRDGADKHLRAGAKKVLISAPTSGPGIDATICYGVNHSMFQPDMRVISTASCTTNCIAPVARVLHDAFHIEYAFVTTVHSYTNDQCLLDQPHKDKRRARAAALSMIPTTTGAAKALALVMPELAGKFDGTAIRVPTPNVSCIDLVAQVSKKASRESINDALRTASLAGFKGIMGYTTDPVVSMDMNGTNESSIVDSLSTMVIGEKLVKVFSWYDNEWGFSNRAVDCLSMLCKACD